MKHNMRPSIALFFLAIVIPLLGQVQEKKPRPLEVDDLFSIQRVGNPHISPDGQWVAYTVGSTDLEKDKSETRVWMIPASGGEAIPMTAKGSSAGQPRWSPDGNMRAV